MKRNEERHPGDCGPWKRILLCALILSPSAFCFSQTEPERYVAKAGGVLISELEFLERFELLPARGRKGRVEEAKLELLYSMIAEKLLAKEAARRGVDMDSSFAGPYEDVRKLLARDELYRQEIAAKVKVTEEDIRQGMERARKRLHVSYLFTPDHEEATFLRARIQTTEDFERLRIDSTMEALRDTVTLDWGTAEPRIEEAGFALSPGEISPAVPAGEGWYILHVTGVTGNPVYTALDVPALRARVNGIVRLRKENERLNEFMPEFLKDRSGYAVGRTFAPFAAALDSVLNNSFRSDSVFFFNPDAGAVLGARCKAILNDTLIVAGATRWTVKDIIDRLVARSLKIRLSDLPKLPQLLSAVLRGWTEHELLAQEALRRGLDRVPSTARQLDMWRQFYLADAMKERLYKVVNATESEVWNYMRTKDPLVRVPIVQIRELRTGTLEDMAAAMAELEQGVPFGEVVEQWSLDPEARRSGGVTPPFPITERRPIGDIAWNMDPGQRYGPLPVRDGQLLVELVSKEMGVPQADTAFAARMFHARQELLNMKRRRLVTIYLAQVAQEEGFTVFEERLRMLKVSETPMMTYRILGFGGRMFAVPFVDQQLDWLDVEPPEQRILP